MEPSFVRPRFARPSNSPSWLARALLPLVLAALLACAAPGRAHACSWVGTPPPPPPDQTELHWGIAFGSVAAVDFAFVAAQIVAGDAMFAEWGAVLEMTFGIVQLVAAPVLSVGGFLGNAWIDSCSQSPSTMDEVIIGSSLLTVAGGWLLAHGIWSLRDEDPPDVMPSVSVGPDAVAMHVLGSF